MTPEPYTQDDYDCGRPPPGWKCTRTAGHEGPCAAVKYHIMTSDKPWIGVDLDATLAHYDEWRGIDHIGPPIEPMRQRVLQWLSEGKEVRILTARVGPQRADITHTLKDITHHIEQWCLQHLGQVLPVTCQKDYNMVAFYDDRCIQVFPNSGETLESAIAALNQRLIMERNQSLAALVPPSILALYEHGHITEGEACKLMECADIVSFRLLREEMFKAMCRLLKLPETPAPLPQP